MNKRELLKFLKEKSKIVFLGKEKFGVIAYKYFNQSVFYCPYCKKIHYHGKGSGYRVSHCINEKSPLYFKQYYLLVLVDGSLDA